MTFGIPVIDLENVSLEAVRAGSEDLGAVQVADLAENSAGRR